MGGIWLYLYLVIDIWGRKVMAWDVDEREEQANTAELLSRACLRERISKGTKQHMIVQPAMETACVWRREKGWRNWACSDPSPAQACRTINRKRNRRSER